MLGVINPQRNMHEQQLAWALGQKFNQLIAIEYFNSGKLVSMNFLNLKLVGDEEQKKRPFHEIFIFFLQRYLLQTV